MFFMECTFQGYQLLKNGKPYGTIISPDILCACISDVQLGETVTLQIVALTDHPVGKLRPQGPGSVVSEVDSGVGSYHTNDGNILYIYFNIFSFLTSMCFICLFFLG